MRKYANYEPLHPKKRPRNRGMAIIAAIMFCTLALFTATFLMRVFFARLLLFGCSRRHQFQAISSNSALAELSTCFNFSTKFPPASGSTCGNWTCVSAGCYEIAIQPGLTSNGVTQNAQACLIATWPSGKLQIDACPLITTCSMATTCVLPPNCP